MTGTENPTPMRVVIIDDDALVLVSLESAISDAGFRINTFDDPLRGVEWIRANGADIVISDVCMPGCDGFEVMRRVKEIDPDCDVIFITAHGEFETAIRALREGATDFFEKPFTPSDLRAAIERTRKFRLLTQQKKLLADQVSVLSSELYYRNSGRSIMIGQSQSMRRIGNGRLT